MATKGNKNKKIEAIEAQTVLESVKDLNLQKVIADVGDLQIQVQSSLANLSGSLSNRIQQIENLDLALKLKEFRLKELHNIESEAVTLDDLKAQRDAEARDWEAEQDARDRAWEEEEIERNKKLKREEDDYLYNLGVKRKLSIDNFENDLAQKKRDEVVRSEVLNRDWTQREAILKSKEAEFTDLKTQVGQFDAKLKTEVSKAEAILGNVLKKQYEHEVALLKKDFESQTNAYGIRVSAMDETITSLQDQIDSLQQQLAQARTDAKEVATQALQSASGRQVADALQRVVDTNSNPQSKNKN